jgi:hypothetical protein
MPLWIYSLLAAPPWSYLLRYGVLCWSPRYLPIAFEYLAHIADINSC